MSRVWLKHKGPSASVLRSEIKLNWDLLRGRCLRKSHPEDHSGNCQWWSARQRLQTWVELQHQVLQPSREDSGQSLPRHQNVTEIIQRGELPANYSYNSYQLMLHVHWGTAPDWEMNDLRHTFSAPMCSWDGKGHSKRPLLLEMISSATQVVGRTSVPVGNITVHALQKNSHQPFKGGHKMDKANMPSACSSHSVKVAAWREIPAQVLALTIPTVITCITWTSQHQQVPSSS